MISTAKVLCALTGLLSACVLMAGCGVAKQTAVSSAPVVSSTAFGVTGKVHGGQQPVIGSRVYLYAVATTNGGNATSLLNGAGFVLTLADGSFSITNDYTCPAGSYVYLLALGGNPGVGLSNAEIGLAAGLGLCSSLGASTYISLNEVTTVATAFALSNYATTETQIGSSSSLSVAFGEIASLVNYSQGAALASSQTASVPQAKINTLANSIAACINSTGIGAPCSTLMSAANVTGANGTPVDTFQAVLNISKNPTSNVQTIFNLGTANSVAQPTLSSAPSDWSIAPVDFNGPIGQDANTYRFATSQGDIYVELRPDVAPANVANFLYYVNNGLYNGSFFHRLVPGFVLQGGGYTFQNGQLQNIATAAPVVNEAKLSNLRGTISMALTGSDPNSATDQFFFNLEDNTSLDAPSTQLQSGGFTVIGQIVGVQGYYSSGGYSVNLLNMDKIGADSVYNFGSPFDALPLVNYSSGSAVGPTNFVYPNITQVTTPAGTVTTPLFSPVSYASSFSSSQLITLTDSTPGAVIYYYVFAAPGGGNNPNPYGVQYTGPFTLPASTYIVAWATAPGYQNQSLYNYEYYSIQ